MSPKQQTLNLIENFPQFSHTFKSFSQLEVDQNFPDIEMSALQDFYFATNGPNWKFPRNIGSKWNFTGNALFYPWL